MIFGFADIFQGNQPSELKVIIYYQNFFNTVLVQQLFHIIQVCTFKHGDQSLFGRHDLVDAGIKVIFKTHVTAGHNTHQLLALKIFNYRHAGNMVLVDHVQQFADSRIRGNTNRVGYHATFIFLHRADFSGLLFNTHALVNDAQTAFLRHGYCQA